MIRRCVASRSCHKKGLTAMASAPSCPPAISSGVTFTAYSNGSPTASSSLQMFSGVSQALAFSGGFSSTVNSYVKVLPLHAGGANGTPECCTGAVTSPSYSVPAYGTALTNDSSVHPYVYKVSLTLPADTYKICVAFDRTGPPFQDTDYSLVSSTQLVVHDGFPPLPPTGPSPLPPPVQPPNPPPSPAPSPPPSPPAVPPQPSFNAVGNSGLDKVFAECILLPYSLSDLVDSEYSPPPYTPPLPAPPNAPPPKPPPSPNAPDILTPTTVLNNDEACITIGHVVLLTVLIGLSCLIIICYCACARYLEGYNCGPKAISSSLRAVNVVPKNKPVNSGKKLSIGASKTNSSPGRICVQACAWSCVAVLCGLIAFGLWFALFRQG